jgi:hypothetical protein
VVAQLTFSHSGNGDALNRSKELVEKVGPNRSKSKKDSLFRVQYRQPEKIHFVGSQSTYSYRKLDTDSLLLQAEVPIKLVDDGGVKKPNMTMR